MNITPASLLREEHVYIMNVVTSCKKIADLLRKEKAVDPMLLLSIVDFLKEYADKCHHAKEEDLFFPAMEHAGVPHNGCPLEALRSEHIKGREIVLDLESSIHLYQVDNENTEQLIYSLDNVNKLYTQHIWKEDEMVFPMESRLFTLEELDDLVEKFEYAEENYGVEAHEHYKEFSIRLLDILS